MPTRSEQPLWQDMDGRVAKRWFCTALLFGALLLPPLVVAHGPAHAQRYEGPSVKAPRGPNGGGHRLPPDDVGPRRPGKPPHPGRGPHGDWDLVFSDVVMAGGMSGVDLARWVREHRPGTRILLTSGFANVAEAGLDIKLLRKPYKQADLARAVREALEG